MEQVHHQWIVHNHEEEEEEEEEEVEDAALKTRQSLPHSKDNLVTGVVVSSSPIGNGGGLSDGVCSVVTNPDRSILQKEEEVTEIENVGENDNHFDDDKVDYAAVGLGLVAEFVGAATNGEAITGPAGATFGAVVSQNKNSVYFDKPQGMWKCHHCTWTKRFDSPWTVPIWNLKGYPDLLMNVKTMIQHGPCFVCETKDNEVNGLEEDQTVDAARSFRPTNPGEREFDVQEENSVILNRICSEVNNQCMKTVDDKVPSNSELSPLRNSSDTQAMNAMNFHSETSTKEDLNLIEEIDQQLKDLDVEAVLAKQETHDLFCPNCNSCITKRVILKKRKRSIHNVDNKAKRDKLDTIVISQLVDSSAHEANQGDHANATSDIVSLEPPAPEREPEVFRCLSCFSFFIPSGKGFNLFRKFGGAREHETSQNPSGVSAGNLQNPSNLPSTNANWFFSVFTSNKGKTASGASLEHSTTDPAKQQHHSPSITSNMITSPEIGHAEGSLADTALVENVKSTPDINHGNGGTSYQISSTVKSVKIESWIENGIKSHITSDNVEDMTSKSFSDEMVSKHERVQLATAAITETLVNAGETSKDAILNPPEFLVPTTLGSPILEKSQKDVDKTPEIIENGYSSLRQGAQSAVQSFGSAILASGVASNKQSSEIDVTFPSKLDFPLSEKVKRDIDEEINPSVIKKNKGGDVIVIVEGEAFKSTASQTADNVQLEGAIMTESHTQVYIGEPPRDEIGEPRQWEILKSIVYGGLIESITSLGIVSSAASSGATPLNIIALGFANLVGGLFILGHNLNELKKGHTVGDQLQMNVQDRYQEQLGRRENFLLHAVVAVLSFLIFGSVPLLIYGLLISKNYYDEVKLAVVAATSIVCIILLAIGKVYTTRPPKSYIKTVLFYVTLSLATSGVSYIAGNLIKDLLDKLSSNSESGFAITMPISDTNMESAWMSY
ncbi:membrane protein of ER body-like protein [Gastrolobium bilobum]|uniref:membrane protein of ER body-like protein n=1 Tax=Gastrolobium bilobum TaxID=150636 RepID=UPI002AB3139A|nr:membrane protein of ER body-like protein [Gastrolobium bilobum]